MPMDRRNFMHRMAATTTAAATIVKGAENTSSGSNATVTFAVRGFTCVTCAIGLEVVLREQKGVEKAKASYRDKRVAIAYNPSVTNRASLQEFINKTTGFTVTEEEQTASPANPE